MLVRQLDGRQSKTASGLGWTRSGTNSYSSEQSIDTDSYGYNSWDNHYTSTDFTSFDTGYSSTNTSNLDLWKNWNSSTWSEHDDGSSDQSYMSGGSHAWNSSFANNYHGAWGSTTYYGGGSGSGSGYGGSASGTTWSYPFYSSTPANPPGSGSGGPCRDGKQRWDGVNLSSQPSTGPELPSALPPSVGVPDLGIGGIAGLESLGVDVWNDLSNAEAFWDAGDSVTDAFAWAGDQLSDLYDTASQWIEDAGVWASATFSNGIEIAGSLITGLSQTVNDVLGALSDLPGLINSTVDAISNMSASDILDGIQGALDVIGLAPGVGEIADGINGLISLARGDYVGAALSFVSMIPIVGDAIGKGGKVARAIATKTDGVLAVAKNITCKITSGLCFSAGTPVLLSSVVDHDDSFLAIGGNSTAVRTTLAVDAVPLGARVARVNPRPWEFDGLRAEPNVDDWAKLTLEYSQRNGVMLDIEMLRPKAELERIGAAVGKRIPLNFNDLLVDGIATIKQIDVCPEIASGEGNVVTARIITRTATELVEVELTGGVRFAGTAIHPVWSVDANDWVPLEELSTGQRLLGDDGPVEIVAVRSVRSAEAVYNLEIHGDHVYQVTELGILVHNACDSRILGKALEAAGRIKPPFLSTFGRSLYQAAHIVPSTGFWWIKQRTELKRIQDLLRKSDLMNAAENGFWAKAGHLGTHTKAYFDDLITEFRGVNTKADALAALGRLRDNIMNGKY